MAGEDVLHLRAVDVLAAGDDHVLLTIDHPDVTLVVHPNEVPGMEPAAGERLRGGGRVVPVASHQCWCPVHGFAFFAEGHVVHVLVDDAGGDGGDPLSDRSAL